MFVVGAVVVGGAIVHSNYSRYSDHSQYSDANEVMKIQELQAKIERYKKTSNSEKNALKRQMDEEMDLIKLELNIGEDVTPGELEDIVEELYEQQLEEAIKEDKDHIAEIDKTIQRILEIQFQKK